MAKVTNRLEGLNSLDRYSYVYNDSNEHSIDRNSKNQISQVEPEEQTRYSIVL